VYESRSHNNAAAAAAAANPSNAADLIRGEGGSIMTDLHLERNNLPEDFFTEGLDLFV